jgi:hypothetical protein
LQILCTENLWHYSLQQIWIHRYERLIALVRLNDCIRMEPGGLILLSWILLVLSVQFSLQYLLQRLDHLCFNPLGIDFFSYRRYLAQEHHHWIHNPRFVVFLWEIVKPVLLVEIVIRPEGESQLTIDIVPNNSGAKPPAKLGRIEKAML